MFFKFFLSNDFNICFNFEIMPQLLNLDKKSLLSFFKKIKFPIKLYSYIFIVFSII